MIALGIATIFSAGHWSRLVCRPSSTTKSLPEPVIL
jgi:hypothetical protein